MSNKITTERWEELHQKKTVRDEDFGDDVGAIAAYILASKYDVFTFGLVAGMNSNNMNEIKKQILNLLGTKTKMAQYLYNAIDKNVLMMYVTTLSGVIFKQNKE